jgi:molecular chaperone IbpA
VNLDKSGHSKTKLEQLLRSGNQPRGSWPVNSLRAIQEVPKALRMKRPGLPVYYYHDHFVEMLSFVRTTYGSILTDEHGAFVLRFQSLSKDAQCLLIRMVNRPGAIFNRTLFRYIEIFDVERAADDLLACGQARTLKADDYASFVACLPKDILVGGAKGAGRTDIRVSWPKAKRPLRNFFRSPLEAKTGFANSFGATLEVAPAVPSGASGLRRAPVVSGASYPSCSLEDLAMRTYDFSPLFRSTIGFDRLFDLAETAQRATEEGYPPYNIERLAEDRYQITLAVAGFSPDEVSITAEQNVVTIEGGKTEKAEREFLYRGISTRHFKRQFSLADYVQVKGATFDNGLLKIELVREIPEAMKPRRIAINGASTADNVHQIEAKAA